MTRLVSAPLTTVRGVIAAAVLEPPETVPMQLGTIVLREDQRRTAARLLSMIEHHGGALLAEPVGLGKTYSALAVAAQLGGEVLVAAPAALRGMWEHALLDARIDARFVTHEALSRGAAPAVTPSLVIVDEAHRLRSPSARRYDALATLCRRAKVLLVTATPMQNRRDDLAAQLALFAGRRAWLMTEEELASHVVRGDGAGSAELPRLSGPHARGLRAEDDCLDDILALPPPVPARDGAVAAALLVFGLVHQWSSSRAALVAALKRRRARGIALASALESGRRPSRAELSAWTHGDDAVQLAFPELVATTIVEPGDRADQPDLLDAVARHGAAVEELLDRTRRAPDPDDERAAVLQAIRQAHPGERVIAFCQYAETVNALRARLQRLPGIAALTAAGARIASGRVSRDAVLAQFTPQPNHRRSESRAERIDLLITTDLLSEGLNLQEASVVVHLDLPWNPARLEQRVGRVRRLGSRFECVTVYTIAPPASASRLLGIEERLRHKIKLAQRTVGVAGRILPAMPLVASPSTDRSLAESHGVVRQRLRSWRTLDGAPQPGGGRTLVAAVEARCCGFLALVQGSDGTQLIASLGAAPARSSVAIAEAADIAGGRETPIAEASLIALIDQLEQWLAAEHAASLVDFRTATASRARRHALARVAQAMARAPRHRRALLAPLVNAARAAAVAPLAEGAERILDMLVSAELPDEAWLRSVAAFGEVNARAPSADAAAPAPAIVALIQFVPR
jgi:superfamily II DNA or RNA helicase